jgi:hypothetical protein
MAPGARASRDPVTSPACGHSPLIRFAANARDLDGSLYRFVGNVFDGRGRLAMVMTRIWPCFWPRHAPYHHAIDNLARWHRCYRVRSGK